ncbi:MAG: hypothetical protein JWN40_5048 [Phycisphaerales bacterium]|nr:hypothetical protein [Phycisphaerales bacterium]
MVQLEQLASAALGGDALRLRELAQEWLRENPVLSDCPPPATSDRDFQSVAAALVELFADRLAQTPPDWTARVGPMREPTFLLKAAQTMRRLRDHCESESPPPLRRRNLYAPANFLAFA